MIHLKDNNAWLPYPAQSYEDKENGIVVKGQTLKLLVTRITSELRGRGLPVPEDIIQKVLEQICTKAPDACLFSDGRQVGSNLKKRFTITDVKAFVKSVEGTITSGGVVDQDTAEERTNVCMRCPYNTNLPGCEGCSGIANLVFKVIGARKTKNMGMLRQCGICGCSLKAKVWVPQDTIKETAQVQNNINDFPDWCWVRK
jgi:hypothetical protein